MKTTTALASLLALVPGGPVAAQAEAITLSAASVPATAAAGADVPLSMRIDNRGDSADSLVRVRCPVAQFTEKRTVDQGEGGTAHREVNAIPVPGNGAEDLTPTGFHFVLLQTKQPLRAGETFTCAVSFKAAGPMQLPVTVAEAP